VSLVATETGKTPLIDSRSGKLQQFGERRRSGVMHGRAHGHLYGFQVDTAALAAAREQDPQELIYFARDLLADRLGRPFSLGVRASSTGRKRQISSFTSRSWPLSSRKR
jgi:hypothetical protein